LGALHALHAPHAPHAPHALRALALAFALAPAHGCDATPGRALSAASAEPDPALVDVVWSPPARGARIAPVVRATLELSSALSADALRAGRVFVVRGGVDAIDLSELARGKTTGALAGRVVPALAWGTPREAPTRVSVQPLAPLAGGAVAVVILRDRKGPLEVDAEVDPLGPDGLEAPIAARIYPPAGHAAASGAAWIYCLGIASPPAPISPQRASIAPELTPDDGAARLAALSLLPCVALTAEGRVGTLAPPPFVDGFAALDPTPVTLSVDAAPDVPAPCAEGELSLGLACARVDDDRVILAAGSSPSWIAGTLGDARVVAPLAAHARVVVRGLSPDAPLALALDVGGATRAHVEHDARTRPAHRHLVVNEALAHPSSGSASQRFLELVNDGSETIGLAGLTVRDGDVEIALPEATLPPGAFALILPDAYVDGLAGETPPAASALRLYVDALKLGGEIAVVDADGTVRSRLPASSSTRTASRGRRTPERPDDALDAFGWDAEGRATPGGANHLAP
jgi:hypothetical protein